MDFSGRKVINDAQRPAHLQSTDVRIISSGKAGLNYGLFNGRTSQIFSERFFAVTFRRLLIRMRFYSDGSGGPEHQILISNCDSMAKPWNIPELGPSQKPSLAIILSRTAGTLTFLGYSAYSTPAIIRLPYSVRERMLSLPYHSTFLNINFCNKLHNADSLHLQYRDYEIDDYFRLFRKRAGIMWS